MDRHDGTDVEVHITALKNDWVKVRVRVTLTLTDTSITTTFTSASGMTGQTSQQKSI